MESSCHQVDVHLVQRPDSSSEGTSPGLGATGSGGCECSDAGPARALPLRARGLRRCRRRQLRAAPPVERSDGSPLAALACCGSTAAPWPPGRAAPGRPAGRSRPPRSARIRPSPGACAIGQIGFVLGGQGQQRLDVPLQALHPGGVARGFFAEAGAAGATASSVVTRSASDSSGSGASVPGRARAAAWPSPHRCRCRRAGGGLGRRGSHCSAGSFTGADAGSARATGLGAGGFLGLGAAAAGGGPLSTWRGLAAPATSAGVRRVSRAGRLVLRRWRGHRLRAPHHQRVHRRGHFAGQIPPAAHNGRLIFARSSRRAGRWCDGLIDHRLDCTRTCAVPAASLVSIDT